MADTNLYAYDPSTGQRYRIDVGPGGAGFDLTPVPGVSLPSENTDRSTITLQDVINFASTHVDLMPITGVAGYTNEPALSLCNDVIQELLSAGYTWKFNRAEMALFFTQRGRQEYRFAGASAFSLRDGKGVGIDLETNGGITQDGTEVTVNTLQDHAFEVGEEVFIDGTGVYDSTFAQTPNGSSWSNGYIVTVASGPRQFKFEATAGLGASGAPGIFNFGELESATMVAANDSSNPQKVWHPTAVRMLKKSSDPGFVDKVCVVSEANGILVLRVTSVPQSTPFCLSLVYQKKAPKKTALTDTWHPFPDEFAFVFRQAFLARAYRYVNSRLAPMEYQKLQLAVAKAIGKDDSESSDEQFAPQTPLMDWSY
jgi:hypothetical protein